MNPDEIDRFYVRVRRKAEEYELAGENPIHARRKAEEYELSLLTGLTESRIAVLRRSITAREDY